MYIAYPVPVRLVVHVIYRSSTDGHTQTSEVLANEVEAQTVSYCSVAVSCSSSHTTLSHSLHSCPQVQTDPEPERPHVLVVDNSAVGYTHLSSVHS